MAPRAARTATPTSTTPPEGIQRTREALLDILEAVDREGWDGPSGTRLLQYIRAEMIRPLAVDIGLRGAMESQAEATAWEVVWLALTKPSLRTAASPWGVLWQAARRAVLSEIVASQFATAERHGWALAGAARKGEVHLPLSLDALIDTGWEAPGNEPDVSSKLALTDALADARCALERVGWGRRTAGRIIAAVANSDPPTSPRCAVAGWRTMAATLDLPAWQARRLTVVLRGTADWPGLLTLLMNQGSEALDDPGMRAALTATRYRSHRSPVLAAARATAQAQHDSQLAA